MSRSHSRSRAIMERARSFERGGESRGNSRPASRSGSGHRREVEEAWVREAEGRPASRTDVDSRRFGEIGRVSTSEWETRIRGGSEQPAPRTPPPRRRELALREEQTRTPEPPPPPARLVHPPNTVVDFPPPPADQSELSEESVGQLSEENKENIVKQWVESTGRAEDLVQELEKFAYNIAESVVTTMENREERKEPTVTSSPGTQVPPSLYSDFWDRQASIPPELAAMSNPATNPAPPAPQRAGWVAGSGTQQGGTYFASPVRSTSRERPRELHGPIYCTEDTKRTGMTFQQEERRREELRMEEEAKQEELRRQQQEQEETKRRQEEELRRQEEKRRLEEERRLNEERMRKQEEEKRRMEEERRKHEEERKRQEEERKRQEEERRKQEELRLRQLELKKAEEERRREELARLRQEEEAKRQEEMRLEQELRRQFQLQQQQEQEELRRRQLEQEELVKKQQEDQKRKYEAQKQREEAEQRAAEARQKQQEAARSVTPRLVRTKSFDKPPPLPLPASEQQEQGVPGQEHWTEVRTGQVMEKRNLWAMRSASMERLPQTSPAPRRRRLDWGKREEEEEVPRPGSSLGQASQTGAVRSLSTGFLSKSKSSSAVANQEDRARPRARLAAGWTRDQEEQKEAFLKSQEVRTNKVTDTVTGWGRAQGGGSGRSTPTVSRTIGDGHSDNHIAKGAADDKSANSWRAAAPEPSVKLVNVTVEKAAGSTQNIHISENAHSQMASFMDKKEEVMSKTRTNTMSSVSSCKSMVSTSSGSRSDVGAPPAPARSTSHGGKETSPTTSQPANTAGSGHPSAHVESGDPVGSGEALASTASETADKPCIQLAGNGTTQTVNITATNNESAEVSSQKSESAKVASIKSESVNAITQHSESAKVDSTQIESANTVSIKSGSSLKSESTNVFITEIETTPFESTINNGVKSENAATTPKVATSKTPSSQIDVSSRSDFSSMKSASVSVGGVVSSEEGGRVAEECGVQASPSTQSVTSILSTCSSSALPLPVRHGWYDGAEPPPTPPSPNLPLDTPLPILASWYEKPTERIENATKKIEKANLKIEQAVSNIDEATNQIEQMTVKCVNESNAQQSEKRINESKKKTTNAQLNKSSTAQVKIQTVNVLTEKDDNKMNIDASKKEEVAAIEQAKKYSDTVIAAVSNDESIGDTCGDDTKQKLNDMFDELVNEQNTLEIIESSEKSNTVKRRQNDSVINKNILLPPDDSDNKSVKSDTTVIESSEPVTEATTSKATEVPESEVSVLTVPQSPRDIRKLFQQPDSFQKPFVRTADAEFGGEMGSGLRGKVRQSRDTFLRQAEADSEVKVGEGRPEVPPSPGQARKMFQAAAHERSEEVERAEEMRQAKMEELEAVRASRAAMEHEAFLAQQVTSAGAREKVEREQELVLLASRRQEEQELEVESAEGRELEVRQERNRELASLTGVSGEGHPSEEPAGRDRLAREERAAELAAVRTRTVERFDWTAGEERVLELKEERQRELDVLAQRKLELPVQEGETKEQELRAARARELADLAHRHTASPQLVAASEQLDEVTEELRQIAEMETCRRDPQDGPTISDEEMRSRVRSTAASWREREQAAEQPAEVDSPAPSRRIGSLFRKDPDYWKLSGSQDELPPPVEDLPEPPPPPRQSSRGKMDEYRAPWRKS